MKISKDQKSFLKKIIPTVAVVGGLCCFTPVILVLFGLSTVAFAASLSDTLYGTYKWAFRGVALVLLFISLGWYFYKKEGVCSLNAVKRKRTKIINFTLLTLAIAVLAYIIWLYVIVELIGIGLGIWG
tara:strand:- start:197 stop:580 length:384 start_codon:yes stop_codon:yes gene_type:complete